MHQQNLARSWGTRFDALAIADSVPSSPEHSLIHMQKPKPATQRDESDNYIHDRVVHDASIFVGSLPSHIEHVELLAMLSEHFSGYSEIQGIKVVRDTKGGTCAFIQCQDPGSSASLLMSLRSSQRQFLGRCLRYEPAKASRALLISYRSPRQYKQIVPAGDFSLPHPGDNEFMELDLPTAMKLIKLPGTRRVTILYNSDATSEDQNDRSKPGNLLLEPLLYDADTLRRIAMVFGPIEHFEPYIPDEDAPGYPNPHDSPRSPIMDPGCWQVKWGNRDDCIAALTMLRRVPHLTVTWAHQSVSEMHNRQPIGSCSTFPTASGLLWTEGAPQDDLNSPESNHFIPLSHSVQDSNANDHSSVIHQVDPVGGLDCHDKTERMAFPTAGTKPQRFRPRALSLNQSCNRPPLPPAFIQGSEDLLSSSWGLSLETRRAWHPARAQRFSSVSERKIFSSATFAAFPSARVVSNGRETSCNDAKQELAADILHTPELEPCPTMQNIPGTFMFFPPTSILNDSQSMCFEDPNRETVPPLPKEMKARPVRDPTTIFVGGLEMYGPKAWDESKLRTLFSKYGGIKFVKVIRPSNKRLAFAFVTFDNTESPVRAITGEHNRVWDGRPIRVQLRDLHPSQRTSSQLHHTKDHAHESESSIVSSDESHDNLKCDQADMSNFTEDMDDLKPGDVSLEDNGPLDPGIKTGASLQNVAKESPPHNSGYIDSEDPGCRVSGKMIAKTNGSREPCAGENTLPGASGFSAPPLIPGPLLPTSYSVPPVAYYYPQGWIPSFGPQFPCQQPFLAHPYMSHSLPPQPVPPYFQGVGAETSNNSSADPVPAPSGALETAQGLPVVYPPGVIGHSTLDADLGQPGVVLPSTNFHVQTPWVPSGFVHGNQGIFVPIYSPNALSQYMTGTRDQDTATPGAITDTSPAPTWLPYPLTGASMQPPPVFFQPFPHPLPYPSHAVGPQGWLSGQSWHGEMTLPSNTPQPLPSGVQPNPPSRPGEIVPSKFERNVPPRRYLHRNNHMQYHKNNHGRSSVGRHVKPAISMKDPPPTVPVTHSR
ncbi:hypothetical protein V8B97DRAFT_1919100 [Scleroderma yunnanense]